MSTTFLLISTLVLVLALISSSRSFVYFVNTAMVLLSCSTSVVFKISFFGVPSLFLFASGVVSPVAVLSYSGFLLLSLL